MANKRVPGIGNPRAKLMIIAEHPGRAESEMGIPFVGPSGAVLDSLLEMAGLARDDVYMTYLVKYQPPLGKWDMYGTIAIDPVEEMKTLWSDEIEKIRPNCILAVGERVLNELCHLDSIDKWRGSILESYHGGHKVVPMLHPNILFPRPDGKPWPWIWKYIIQHDFLRTADQAAFADVRRVHRDLYVAESSLDVHNFFQEYRSCRIATSDIESINCVPVCVGFAFNSHHALSIPLLGNVGGNVLSDMSNRELAECWKMIDEAYGRHRIVGQNFKYDAFKLGLIGFSDIHLDSDTLLLAHTIFPELPEKNLAMLASLFTEEPFWKDEGKEPKFGKFNVRNFFLYNAKDCAVNYEVNEYMLNRLHNMAAQYQIPLDSFYRDFVVKKHRAYLRMERRGFRVDKTTKMVLTGAYEYIQETIHEDLTELVGYDVNVKSAPQVFDLLYKKLHFRCPKKAPTSEDAIVGILNNQCKTGKGLALKKAILARILDERRIRDQISRAYKFELDYDDRCRTSVNIVGTETGRTSTGILKKPIRPKKLGLAYHTIPKHGDAAKHTRSMLIPDEGFVFIQGDLSQAEARIVAVLAEDYELLRAFDIIDIHRRTAALFFGLTKNLILTSDYLPGVDDMEKDGPRRFTGKTFRHAGNYDMGAKTAMENYNTAAQKNGIPGSISEWKAGYYINLFHAASPNIRKVFHTGIREALDTSRVLINPYGRPREFFGELGDDLYKEGYAQIPQSTVADTTQSALIRIDDEWQCDDRLGIISENHDALVAQVPLNEWRTYAKSMRQLMQIEIDFSKYCTLRRDYKLTIPVDIEVSINPKTGLVTNYGELYKASKIPEGVAA